MLTRLMVRTSDGPVITLLEVDPPLGPDDIEIFVEEEFPDERTEPSHPVIQVLLRAKCRQL